MDNTIIERLQRRVKDLESAEIKTQYSRDGSGWHDVCASDDTYIRISRNGGKTWGGAVVINRVEAKSDSGKGVVSGGEEGQILTKKSCTDYDTEWKSVTTADIPDVTDKKYVTDNQLNVLSNTSNVNTGDETATSIKSKLGITTLSGVNTGDQMLSDLGGIPLSQKGSAEGVAELDSNGRIPQSQLPSYVDDVLDYAAFTAFPPTGESGKIYVADDTNLAYRWSGSGYSVISPTLALGETMSTAYRGDRGKTAFNHSQITGNPHRMTKADLGLGNVTNDAQVKATESAVADGDIVLFNGSDGKTIKDAGYAPANLIKCINRQDNTTNSSVSNQLIQAGWGYVGGPASATFTTKTVSFPATFDNVPIIIVNYLGYKTSTPTSESDFLIGAQYAYGLQPTASGFTAAIYSRDSALNLTSSYYYGFSWIAIGTTSR